MSDPTRGITCPDMRRVVRAALDGGWEWGGFTGSTHCKIVWPKSGATLVFGTTPSVASWKSLATDVARESGVEVWRKGNRRRSRKAVRMAGYTNTRPAPGADRVASEISNLLAEFAGIERQLEAAVATGDRPGNALELITRRLDIAVRLRDLHQPIPPTRFPLDDA